MDTQEITLPISGKVVVIRAYTTHKDDLAAERVLYANVNANKAGDFDFPVGNIMAMNEVYARRLVISVDGNSNRTHVESEIDNLRSKDYEAIEKVTNEIVEGDSPKAQGVLSGSRNSTDKK